MDGPVRVAVFAFVPVPKSWSKKKQEDALAYRKPDGDNFLKIIDSLNGCVWRDDAQAIVSTVVKVYGPTPQLRIEVLRVYTGEIVELMRNREAA
jgi:Holliday junction resolvase RusA-like endonuclease